MRWKDYARNCVSCKPILINRITACMFLPMIRLLSYIVFFFNISCAAANTGNVTVPAGKVLAAWSQIVGTGKIDPSRPAIVARFVLQGLNQDCSSFALKSATALKNIKASSRSNPDPSSFPITLCQAGMLTDWSDVSLLEGNQPAHIWNEHGNGPFVTFSGPTAIGSNNKDEIVMITLGDTGCRGSKNQAHCSSADRDWPFYNIIQAATSKYEPDFVIHAGDYRYYQEGHSPDTWDYWQQDFFAPAQKLLLAAPWAFSRGNHEQCHNSWAPYWYGTGWLYFFEPTASLETARCPEKPREILVEPWYFDITVAGLEPHRFIMIDTAPDFPEKKEIRGEFSQHMHKQLSSALDMANEASGAWWISHRPFLSLSYYKKSWHYADQNIRKTLDSVLANRPPLCKPECSPSTILAGHIHQYQNIRYFAQGKTSGAWLRPQTMIVGNGGVVDVEGLNTSPCRYDKFPLDDSITGVVNWNTQHGFTSWSRSSASLNEQSGWLATPYFINDQASKTENAATKCGPASNQ